MAIDQWRSAIANTVHKAAISASSGFTGFTFTLSVTTSGHLSRSRLWISGIDSLVDKIERLITILFENSEAAHGFPDTRLAITFATVPLANSIVRLQYPHVL